MRMPQSNQGSLWGRSSAAGRLSERSLWGADGSVALGDLASGSIQAGSAGPQQALWSTFYDIRRYGGLQIFLRALLGGGSMVLSSARESTGDFLLRAAARGVTHMLGTPTHWRNALMSPSARRLTPQFVRLSGGIADEAHR